MASFTPEQAARLGFNLQIFSGILDKSVISIIEDMVASNDTGGIDKAFNLPPKSAIAFQYLRSLQDALEFLPHDTTTRPSLIGYSFMIAFTIFVIIARLFIRFNIHGKLRCDDYAAV